MEAVEEIPLPLQNDGPEVMKVVNCEEILEASVQSDVCHKSNGITDSKDCEQVLPSADENETPNVTPTSTTIIEEKSNAENIVTELEPPATEIATKDTVPISEEVIPKELGRPYDVEMKTDNPEEIQAEEVEIDGIVETMPDNVRFETEILIETNVDDQTSKYQIIYDDVDEPDQSNNILNELGQNIELSEVLRSSDVTENVENNNSELRQEVFNKEELLDILEGNDIEETGLVSSDNFSSDCKKLETQLALQQLSRLKHVARRSRHTPKKSDKKSSKKSDSPKDEEIKKKGDSPKERVKKKSDVLKEGVKKKIDLTKEEGQKKKHELSKEEVKKKSNKQNDDSQTNNIDTNTTVEPKEESIVNALVKDWEDDEPSEGEQKNKVIQESENLLAESEELVQLYEVQIEGSKLNNTDSSMGEGQTPTPNKNVSETQPQRRLARVIKKKVIFDPDNPDTFTKTKVVIKKDNQFDKDQKDQPTPKKIKTDPRSPRSKSPIQSKLQWKKPQPKNLKQHKRRTEIDRLLMDEGAVNMICQLTPEAPKGHKNTKSKAEFIKKIQSSTPDGKEMKFRERKKELKYEELDAKRIGSGKDRLSLSSSVKSPAISDDFEAHSADDSIIYRRHSSSSYSSPCMSPRRLSDVESVNQNAQALSQNAASERQSHVHAKNIVSTGSDVFMSENAITLPTGIINKSDLLSIKEKLNSKLSQALNKRKRDSTKTEKPTKIKKVPKATEKSAVDYKYVKLTIDHQLAEICIQKEGSIYGVEVINELKSALETVDSKINVSVTLLTAESGILCSGMELKPLLDQENSLSYAQELSESVSSLFSTLEGHSKLVCAAVEDRCYGLGIAIVALSDITVASELATFQLSSHNGATLQPGVAALTTCGLSQSLLNEIVVLERPVSAAEALNGGLVSRTVWPERFLEQVRTIAKDVAAQPVTNILMKKQLLRHKRGGSESLLAGLIKERDLFIKYWTSEEGRELVCASLAAME